jgi:hypothetical protein
MRSTVSPGVGFFLDEREFTGATTDSFTAIETYNNVKRFFGIMENTHGSNGLQWRVVVRATSGGNEEVLYGPTTLSASSKDAHMITGGAYFELRVEVKSAVAGNASSYKLQAAVTRKS